MIQRKRKELICDRISKYSNLECSASKITSQAHEELKEKQVELQKLKESLELQYYSEFSEQIADQLFDVNIELEHTENELATIVELDILYLYKSYEFNLKQILKWAFPTSKSNQMSNINDIINFLKKKGIQVRNLEGFPHIDALRLLNNSVKHNGFVNGKSLGKANCRNMQELAHYISSIKIKIEVFLQSLINLVKKCVMANQSVKMNQELSGLEVLSIFAVHAGRYT
ncbi:hypothetical protein FG064_18885 [Vibrio cholerae]|uniref:hypothetical protein n=1 Tax=Vibrio cholerae TaxID=666 RepID=UPI0011D3FDD9|nr:hypothetical protein [Vibrio cholerae]EGR0469034.1 hypothetical protein [Vibrio cholerae]ELE5880834.1 hypothetical protein [Vibrio cholerae]MDV2391234.1 hypothetical protein [Vibrio cholerae]TXY50102.1 hypothetical protein FXE77_09865 [Vibrio cholerae]